MKHIFLVEDDLEIAKNLVLLLRSEGFTITHAATQKEAILMLAAQKYDLALLDISLPDGNGFAVCTRISSKLRTFQ
ncbi:response regulator transcription factor [Lysinibacillus sphaericus]|uniref:response regulator transcription factor n=1 Tax=Lysinibacillus sphaericus TaxID=1421 RepID=UPI003D7147E4